MVTLADFFMSIPQKMNFSLVFIVSRFLFLILYLFSCK